MDNRDELRRTAIFNCLSNAKVASPLKNDDDQERTERQKEVELQRRLSEIRSNPENKLNRFFNEIEAKDHFHKSHKLFSENKITPKNVWHIRVIDILTQVVKEKKEKNLLQFAGTSLDISAKVYGIRVDEVHSFGLKLATNLTKTDKQNRGEREDSSNSDNDNRQNGKKKVNRKLKKRLENTDGKKQTIDEKATISVSLKQLQKPPFSIEDKVDADAVDNLLTMRLPLNPMGHTFSILNNEKYKIKERDIVNKNSTTTTIELNDFMKICPQFDDFIVNQIDPINDTQFTRSINNSKGNHQELLLDNNGLPIAELDGSIHDIFPVNDDDNNDNNVDINDEDRDEVIEEQQQLTGGAILEIVNGIPIIDNEYGFNPIIKTISGKVIDKIWAGPAHWKMKHVRRTNLQCSGNTTIINQQQIKVKRKKKTIEIIDLNGPELFIYDLSKKIVNKRKTSMNFDKVTLPSLDARLLDFDKHVHGLFLKARSIHPHKTEEDIEINVEKYNYNNPNDSLYCSQIDFNDDADDVDDNDNSINNEQIPNNFDDLVDLPEMAEVSYLKYALHAKKINIKKLKATVWEQLTNGNNDNKIEPVCFTQLYKQLPNKLEQKMKAELSVALAFNSVLYLCNEKFLNLIQTNYGDVDFEIVKLN